MDWTALLATALGALIGVGSTLAAGRIQWRRETEEVDRDRLEARYVDYLEALANARDGVSAASREMEKTVQERSELARTAFVEHSVYAKVYLLELIAPADVVEIARDATAKLTVYRDVVVAGATRDDPACVQARRDFRQAREKLMAMMRATLAREGQRSLGTR
ncbi:hypothetical protein ACWEFL_00485 [Streptomyces sp. NPDC004838]